MQEPVTSRLYLNVKGRTPFYHACINGHTDVVKMLTDKSAGNAAFVSLD